MPAPSWIEPPPEYTSKQIDCVKNWILSGHSICLKIPWAEPEPIRLEDGPTSPVREYQMIEFIRELWRWSDGTWEYRAKDQFGRLITPKGEVIASASGS